MPTRALSYLVGRACLKRATAGRFAANQAAGISDPAQRWADLRVWWPHGLPWGTLWLCGTGRRPSSGGYGRSSENLNAHQDIGGASAALILQATARPTRTSTLGRLGGVTGLVTWREYGGCGGCESGLNWGTLVDFPELSPRSVRSSGGRCGEVTTVGQSFFDPLPAGADLYLLKKV